LPERSGGYVLPILEEHEVAMMDMPAAGQPSFIRWFKHLGIRELASVGGKNASLGELYGAL
jgi:hypothetical protein